jgi:hypothetical protein
MKSSPKENRLMINRRSLAALVCVAGAVPALAVAGPAAAAPTASAAATCSKLPSYPGVGYFTSLKAYGLGCTTAKKVMVAHYKCRTKTRKTGTCKSFSRSGTRWTCTEKRVQGTENYNSRVTCKSGTKKVVYTYQQDK